VNCREKTYCNTHLSVQKCISPFQFLPEWQLEGSEATAAIVVKDFQRFDIKWIL